MAGAAIGHSILLGGPAFPVLHPTIYSSLVGRVVDPADIEDLPCSDDIPLNAATADTKNLITKVVGSHE